MTLKMRGLQAPSAIASCGHFSRGRQEVVMGTVDIHEPEVKGVEPGVRGKTAVMPRAEMVLGPPLPPRPMFADSVLDFGGQSKRKAMATTTSFIVNCLAICMMLLVPLMFTEELPKGQLLTMLIAPPAPRPPHPHDAQSRLRREKP